MLSLSAECPIDEKILKDYINFYFFFYSKTIATGGRGHVMFALFIADTH